MKTNPFTVYAVGITGRICRFNSRCQSFEGDAVKNIAMKKIYATFCAMVMIAVAVLSLIAVPQALAASLTMTGPASHGIMKTGAITSVSYTLSEIINGNVVVIINGSAGNTVSTDYLPEQAAGAYTYTWDGTYDNGTPVPDDYYTITITVNNGTLGGTGTGNFEYWSPFGLDIDESGNIYVADMVNHRVQIFDSNGVFIRTLGITGEEGTDNAHFKYPYSVAVNKDGNIYVADMGNKRVQVFSNSGSYLRTIGPEIPGTTGFWAPMDVAVDDSGNTYVVDWGALGKLQIFDNTGTRLMTIGSFFGTGDYEFYLPSGVDVDETGNIYVADNGNHRIQVFDSAGIYSRTIGIAGVSGSDNAHFNMPNDVAVDKSGNIYVADMVNNRIQVLDSNGAYLRTIGTGVLGNRDDEFYNPNYVKVDDGGNIYVSDVGNDRIRVFYSNMEVSSTVYVDNTPPTVSFIATGTEVNEWYTSDVSITLDASDDKGGSGLDMLVYSLDNEHWNTYTGAFTISEEGSNVVYWNCSDNVGNFVRGSQTILLDKSAPVISGAATTVANANGWYNHDVQVNFTAADISGLASITPDTTLSGEGTGLSASCTAVDIVGFTSNLSITGINIDKTAPVTVVNLTGTQRMDGVYLSDIGVTLSATDGLSGLNFTMYRTNEGAWTRYNGPFTINGTSTLYVRSADNAGNVESQDIWIRKQIHTPWYEGSWWGKAVTIIQTAMPEPTNTSTSTPDVTPTPAVTSTPTPMPTTVPSPAINVTPTATETGSGTQIPGYLIWLVLLGIIAIVIVAGGYFLFIRK